MWAEYVTGMEMKIGVCKVLVGKRKRQKTLGRPRCKWELNTKTDVTEICWRAWTALLWMCENSIREIHLTWDDDFCGAFCQCYVMIIRMPQNIK